MLMPLELVVVLTPSYTYMFGEFDGLTTCTVPLAADPMLPVATMLFGNTAVPAAPKETTYLA